jgi:hypothetical protein
MRFCLYAFGSMLVYFRFPTVPGSTLTSRILLIFGSYFLQNGLDLTRNCCTYAGLGLNPIPTSNRKHPIQATPCHVSVIMPSQDTRKSLVYKSKGY